MRTGINWCADVKDTDFDWKTIVSDGNRQSMSQILMVFRKFSQTNCSDHLNKLPRSEFPNILQIQKYIESLIQESHSKTIISLNQTWDFKLMNQFTRLDPQILGIYSHSQIPIQTQNSFF
jgi:hypothetical protein